MIVSYTEGRVRLRFKELKNKVAAAAAQQYISSVEGITEVEINPATGSLLIQYDPRVLPTEKLLEKGKAALDKLGIGLELPEGLGQ